MSACRLAYLMATQPPAGIFQSNVRPHKTNIAVLVVILNSDVAFSKRQSRQFPRILRACTIILLQEKHFHYQMLGAKFKDLLRKQLLVATDRSSILVMQVINLNVNSLLNS